MGEEISLKLSGADAVLEAIRTTGATRYLSTEDVPDSVIVKAIEAARFGPSGGNRQPVRWIVVRDPKMRKRLADLYQPLWDRDMEMFLTGQMRTGATLGPTVQAADYMSKHYADAPAIVVATVQKADMHAHMKGPDGPNMVGGSSIYPFVQNFCLALRSMGVGSCITTLLTECEEQVAKLLNVPDEAVCACHILVGYPQGTFPTQLNRMPLEELIFSEKYGVSHPSASGGK